MTAFSIVLGGIALFAAMAIIVTFIQNFRKKPPAKVEFEVSRSSDKGTNIATVANNNASEITLRTVSGAIPITGFIANLRSHLNAFNVFVGKVHNTYTIEISQKGDSKVIVVLTIRISATELYRLTSLPIMPDPDNMIETRSYNGIFMAVNKLRANEQVNSISDDAYLILKYNLKLSREKGDYSLDKVYELYEHYKEKLDSTSLPSLSLETFDELKLLKSGVEADISPIKEKMVEDIMNSLSIPYRIMENIPDETSQYPLRYINTIQENHGGEVSLRPIPHKTTELEKVFLAAAPPYIGFAKIGDSKIDSLMKAVNFLIEDRIPVYPANILIRPSGTKTGVGVGKSSLMDYMCQRLEKQGCTVLRIINTQQIKKLTSIAYQSFFAEIASSSSRQVVKSENNALSNILKRYDEFEEPTQLPVYNIVDSKLVIAIDEVSKIPVECWSDLLQALDGNSGRFATFIMCTDAEVEHIPKGFFREGRLDAELYLTPYNKDQATVVLENLLKTGLVTKASELPSFKDTHTLAEITHCVEIKEVALRRQKREELLSEATNKLNEIISSEKVAPEKRTLPGFKHAFQKNKGSNKSE